MAFTSGKSDAGSDSSHQIHLDVNGRTRHLSLYDRPGDDMEKNKGDLWEFEMEEFDFPGNCITISSIKGVAIDEGGNDAWNIDTIVTTVREEGKKVPIAYC